MSDEVSLIAEKTAAFDAFLAKLGKLWNDGLENFWGTKFFDVAANPIPSDATAIQVQAHGDAKTLAVQLNSLVAQFEMERHIGPNGDDFGFLQCNFAGFFAGCSASTRWPSSATQLGSDLFHDNVLAPFMVEFAEDLKVLTENSMLSNIALLEETMGDYDWFGLTTPSDNIAELIENTMLAAAEYLQLFPQFSFSVKKNIPPAAPTEGLGPGPIFSDVTLENSFDLKGWPKHYIGFLLDEGKSNGKNNEYYLPARVAPSEEGLFGWSDENYSLVNESGDLVKPEGNSFSDGIDIPLGAPVVVTEIINSETGIWVGFIPVLDYAWYEWEFVDSWTNSFKRVLYTRPEFLRIKEKHNNPNSPSYSPDPYISHKTTNSESPEFKPHLPEAFDPIAPLANQNWYDLGPKEAVLTYYNFNEHNKKVAEDSGFDLTYDPYDVASTGTEPAVRPQHRYSEGYFYFIIGESNIPSENEIDACAEHGLSSTACEFAKDANYRASIEEARGDAWKNLLTYFGKDTAGGNINLRDRLKKDHFVVAGSKVNTGGAVPNHKILFAIRASYIDALPDTRKPYGRDFEAGSSFLSGNTYEVSFYTDELVQKCKDLSTVLTKIKTAKGEDLRIEDPNGTAYDIDIQIQLIDDMAQYFQDFLKRQGYPSSTDKDSLIANLAREAAAGNGRHIIQIGVKDNGFIGAQVRNTLSYVLFSPDPASLKAIEDPAFKQKLGLFYFDPYLPGELTVGEDTPRSAVPLKIGISVLRDRFAGTYGSRALHYLLAYYNIITFDKQMAAEMTTDLWVDFLTKYTVPPVLVYPSNDPAGETVEEEDIDCEELINQLNSTSPTTGYEEKLLQEKIFGSTKCSKLYRDQWKHSTPATDPETSKEAMEKKLGQSEVLTGADLYRSDASNFKLSSGLSQVYKIILSHIDIPSIVALLIACITKQLGIPLTAEALCREAIKKLIESMGLSAIETTILANTLLDPGNETYQQVMDGMSTNPYGSALGRPNITLDAAFAGAPIAASLKVLADEYGGSIAYTSGQSITNDSANPLNYEIILADGTTKIVNLPAGETYTLVTGETATMRGTYGASPEYITAIVVMAIKNFERSGGHVELVPGPRPQGVSGGGEIQILTDDFSGRLSGTLLNEIYGDNISVPAEYTWGEINAYRENLKEMGYSDVDADAVLIERGYLIPKASQYTSLLGEGSYFDHAGDLFNDLTTVGASPGIVATNAHAGARAAAENADAWLQYMEMFADLQTLCELIVGPLLEGFEDLLSDPLGFLSGGFFTNFIEQLKRIFSPPVPTLNFPDSLTTDNHLGDYVEALGKALLMMVGMIIGQIIDLVLKHFLEKCLEEADLDLGPVANPFPESPPVEIPLSAFPYIGAVPPSAVSDWAHDTIDDLSPGQVCALLHGDASNKTLNTCLRKLNAFPAVWFAMSGGVGEPSIHDVASVFKQLGDKIAATGGLDICDLLQVTSPAIDDICNATYDKEARCNVLRKQGLTKDQCEIQTNNELEDLKNKLAAIASMSSFGGKFDSNPFLSAFPPMCAEGGGFTVPPGMEDSMKRVVDNYLTHVKGSLSHDLNTLKFFTLTPRAIIAANDPTETKKVLQDFTNAQRRPNIKLGMAFIGDPEYFKDYLNFHDEKLGNIEFPSYCLAYNKHFHYRLYLDANGQKKERPSIQAAAAGDAQEWQPFNLRKRMMEYIAEHASPATHKELFLEGDEGLPAASDSRLEELEIIEKQQKQGGPRFGNKYFVPITIADFFENKRFHNIYPSMVKIAVHVALEELELTDGEKAILNALSLVPIVEGIYKDLPPAIVWLKDANYLEALKEVIRESYKKDLKPVWLEKTIIEPKIFIKYDQNQVGKKPENQGILTFKMDSPQKGDPRIIGPSHSWDAGVSKRSGKPYFRTPRSVHMKLKDIWPQPKAWLHMFRAYTGIKTPSPAYTFVRPSGERGNWVERYGFCGHPYVLDVAQESYEMQGGIASAYHVREVDDDGVVVEWESVRDVDGDLKGPEWDPDFDCEGPNCEAWPTKNDTSMKTPAHMGKSTFDQWRQSCEWSPGMAKVLEETDKLYKDGFFNTGEGIDKDCTGSCTIGDLHNGKADYDMVWGFMQLTIGEATGLTDERLLEIYPNFPSAETLQSVIFTAIPEYPVDVLDSTTVHQYLPTQGECLEWGFVDDHIGDDPICLDHAPGGLEGPSGAVVTHTLPEDIIGNNPGPVHSKYIRGWSFVPLYVVFGQPMRRPDDPFGLKPEEMIDHFSDKEREINPRILKYLTNETTPHGFPQSMGYTDRYSYNLGNEFGRYNTYGAHIYHDAINLEKYENFNPNILMYSLPTLDPSQQSVEGWSGSTSMIDGAAKSQDLLDTFKNFGAGNPSVNLPIEVSTMLNQMQVANKDISFIYQNISVPLLSTNFTSHISSIRDNFRIAKGKLTGVENYSVPPGPLAFGEEDPISSLQDTAYDFSFFGEMDEDIQDLLENIYEVSDAKGIFDKLTDPNKSLLLNKNHEVSTAAAIAAQPAPEPQHPYGGMSAQDVCEAQDIDDAMELAQCVTFTNQQISNFEVDLKNWQDAGAPDLSLVDLEAVDLLPKSIKLGEPENKRNAYKLDSLNFKARIFGRLLLSKFNQKYNKYSNSNTSLPYAKEDFNSYLEFIFSTYCFTSLQYTYSNQMFSKMKRSRLHKKGHMRKLWNKILVTSLTKSVKGGKSDASCYDLFESAGSADAAAAQIGSKIAENAAAGIKQTETDFFKLDGVKGEILAFYRKSLCRDIYDNRSMGDISVKKPLLQGSIKLLIRVYALEMCLASIIAWDSFEVSDIIKNNILIKIILKNIEEDFSIDELAKLTEDMYKKEQDLTEEQYIKGKSETSALEFYVKGEADKISGLIKEIFKNNSPISTALNLDILSSSDSDYTATYNKLVGPTPVNSQKISSLYEVQGADAEYITDVRFQNNIYTMNYGAGVKPDIVAPRSSWITPEYQLADSDVRLYGHRDPRLGDDPFPGIAKKFFHSLPYTHFTLPYSLIYDEAVAIGGEHSAAAIAFLELTEPVEPVAPDTTTNPTAADWTQYFDELTAYENYNNKKANYEATMDKYNFQYAYSEQYKNQIAGQWFFGRAGHFGSSYYWDSFGAPIGWVSSAPNSAHKQSEISWDSGDFSFQKFLDMQRVLPKPIDTDKTNDLANEFKKYVRLQRNTLGNADPFSKENWTDIQYGNNLNAKLGNITIQPYVKVEDWSIEDLLAALGNLKIPLFQEEPGDPFSAVPCPDPTALTETSLSDHINLFEEFLKELNEIRQEKNIFKSYIFDYIPLSVWSYFYTNIFLKLLYNKPKYEILLGFYQKHGWLTFFKSLKFGLRLNYSTSFPILESPDLRFKEYMCESFSIGKPPSAPGTVDMPVEGLKRCKTLIGQRPYVIKDTRESIKVSSADYADWNLFDTGAPLPGDQSLKRNGGVRILNELQIPIVEVEREVIPAPADQAVFSFRVGKQSLSTGAGNLFSVNEMGYYYHPGPSDDPAAPGTLGVKPSLDANLIIAAALKSGISWPTADLMPQYPQLLKHLTNTTDRFFYKHLATNLVEDLKDTPEFRLMYNHLFPQDRYMAMAFLYAGEGLSKFIPEPTDVLDETKRSILRVVDTLAHSGDYTHPTSEEHFELVLGDLMSGPQSDTRGKNPSLTKQILEIILKTPLYILKGFVEITDPAIMIAKAIIDIANAIHQMVFAAIEMGLMIAKTTMQMSIGIAKVAMINLQVNVEMAFSILKSVKMTFPEELRPFIIICSNNDDDGCEKGNIETVTGGPGTVVPGRIESWKLFLDEAMFEEGGDQEALIKELTTPPVPPEGFDGEPPPARLPADVWENFKEQFKTANGVFEDFKTAKEKLQGLEDAYLAFDKEVVKTIAEAKAKMAGVLTSPYLLPGLWAAMIPSMTPLLGGLMPPPFPGGPPSTIPGMIYLLLLFLDDYEQMAADLAEEDQGEGEFNCDDYL